MPPGPAEAPSVNHASMPDLRISAHEPIFRIRVSETEVEFDSSAVFALAGDHKRGNTMTKQSQKNMGGRFRVKITEPKQAMIGVALITLLAFGMKYMLSDTDSQIPKKPQAKQEDGGKPLSGSAYAITGASWATEEDMVGGVVSPAGGANAKPKVNAEVVDPEEVRRMKEAAETWQGLDIAVRDH